MNIVLKKFGVISLLCLGVAGAFATPGGQWEQQHEISRTPFVQQMFADDGNRRNEQLSRHESDRRRFRDSLPEARAYGPSRDNGMNGASDTSKKQGKLTPEERRALRRQIDEASHDIYTQKR